MLSYITVRVDGWTSEHRWTGHQHDLVKLLSDPSTDSP
jgi:hypothetical protein